MTITNQDISIVQYLSCGIRCNQIARALNKSPRTVEKYISDLLWKHKAKSQAHLVAIFLRSELIL